MKKKAFNDQKDFLSKNELINIKAGGDGSNTSNNPRPVCEYCGSPEHEGIECYLWEAS